MAAPAFRAITMLPGTSGTTRVYTVPASAAPGDLLLVWAYIETTGITFSLSGWTKVAETTQASEGWVAVCFALPSWDGKTTEYTLSWGGAKKRNSGAIEAIAGAETKTPINAQSGAGFKENASSKNAVVAGLTTSVDECLLISGVFNDNGSLASPASGWTEDGDQADSPQIAHKTASVSKGEQASVTHTLGIASINLTLMLAIQPAPGSNRRRFTSVG
ncbi:MAG TPA: hypothetical protein VF085_01365 [Solirubrobacterales bacterium]